MNPQIEKILKLPLYQRMLILLSTVLVLSSFLIYLLVLPKHKELGQLRAKKQQVQQKLQEDQRIADNLPQFKAEFEKMQEQLNAALAELPNDKEIPTLLTNIASLAKDNGLDVLRFKPGNENPKGFYAEVPVELKLTGSFHQVALFFNSIAELSRIVNMNNVSISAKTGEVAGTLSVDCMATTFRFVEEPQNVGTHGKGAQK